MVLPSERVHVVNVDIHADFKVGNVRSRLQRDGRSQRRDGHANGANLARAGAVNETASGVLHPAHDAGRAVTPNGHKRAWVHCRSHNFASHTGETVVLDAEHLEPAERLDRTGIRERRSKRGAEALGVAGLESEDFLLAREVRLDRELAKQRLLVVAEVGDVLLVEKFEGGVDGGDTGCDRHGCSFLAGGLLHFETDHFVE